MDDWQVGRNGDIVNKYKMKYMQLYAGWLLPFPAIQKSVASVNRFWLFFFTILKVFIREDKVLKNVRLGIIVNTL